MNRLLAVGFVMAVAACGSDEGLTPIHPPPPPNAVAVSITDAGFNPATLTVSVGRSVTWTNNGTQFHSVTADNGTFGSIPIGGGGEVFSYTFNAAGTVTYHCSIHPTMTGAVVVTAP